MKPILKYNLLKGISMILSVGTPTSTMIILNESLADSPAGAISIAGIIVILMAALIMKDKIAENFKMPSALVLSISLFIIILLLENIIVLAKYTCVATAMICAIDELTFKSWYKRLEKSIIKKYDVDLNDYKKIGFIFGTSKKILGVE